MKDKNELKLKLFNGIVQQNLPNHKNLPYLRKIMANNSIFGCCNIHIAFHCINKVVNNSNSYCKLHSHEVDEFNLIIGKNEGKGLKYKLSDGTKEVYVDSPHSVFIPKNTLHSAEAIEGEGYFVCIIMDGDI